MCTLIPKCRGLVGLGVRACFNSSNAANEKYELIESRAENKFLLKLNSHYAYVNYVRKGNVYDLVYTYVPEDYQTKGVGKILAMKTFDYIASKNLKFVPTCDYLKMIFESQRGRYDKFVVL